ncbi:MAG: hypothetical protein ABI960_08090, partial [Candidatus Eisenbacteria bacterium]
MATHRAWNSLLPAGVAIALVFTAAAVSAGPSTWTGNGPRARSLEAIARDPLQPARMWAAAFGAGVYRSLDGGATWTAYRSGLTNTFVRCLADNPAHPDSIWCGANDGVFLSVDGGVRWSLALATTGSVRGITLQPARPSTVYASTYGDGIFKSINGGLSWSAIDLGLANPNVRGVAVDPSRTNHLLSATGTGSGIEQSQDGGLNWSVLADTTASAGAAESVVFDGLGPLRVYAGTFGRGVLRSLDGGTNWTTINRGLGDLRTRALVLADTVRYVGTQGSGVFWTSLTDTVWHPAGAGITAPTVDALFASPSNAAQVWAGTDGGGLFRSDNRGSSWTQLDGGLLSTYGFALAVRPWTHALYAGLGFGDQFWKSTDGAVSWTRARFLFSRDSEHAVAVDPAAATTLYLTAYGSGVYRSTDDGATWENPDSLGGTLGNPFVRALVAWPAQSGHLLVGTGAGPFESLDGGATWVSRAGNLPASFGVHALAIRPGSPTSLFAGNDSAGV